MGKRPLGTREKRRYIRERSGGREGGREGGVGENGWVGAWAKGSWGCRRRGGTFGRGLEGGREGGRDER